MMDWSNRRLTVANVLFLLSVTLLAGLLAILLLVPLPSTQGLAAQKRKKEFAVQLQMEKAKESLAESEVRTDEWLSLADNDKLSSSALDLVTRAAAETGLKVVAFRPQRVIESTRFEAAPFLVSLDGDFTKFAAWLKRVDQPKNRLAVQLVQLNAADGDTSRVSASVSLMAFRKPVPPAGSAGAAQSSNSKEAQVGR